MKAAIRRNRWLAIAFVVGLVLGITAYARIGPDAAGLDPGVQAALLLVISVALAATAGAAGAVLGANIAAEAVRESARLTQAEAQADRDDARLAREADHQEVRRTRFAERKLELAVDLLLAADQHSREADQHIAAMYDRWNIETEYGVEAVPNDPIPDVGSTEPVRRALLALDVVAPGSAPAANALYRATLPLGPIAAKWEEPHQHNDYGKAWSKGWHEARENWNDARHVFVEAVREDLGVNPED